jgi:hypothetical protein
VINRGYSGDAVATPLNRWYTPSGADITVINYGINDATGDWIPYKGQIDQFLYYYERLIVKEVLQGSAIVILTPIKKQLANNHDTDIFSDALYLLGQKYNIPVITGDELLANYDASIYSDGLHLNGKGYTILGAKIASIFIGEGCAIPRYVASGSKLLTRPTLDNVKYGGDIGWYADVVNKNTPDEMETNKGMTIILQSVGGFAIYSLYTEHEDLLCFPIGGVGSNSDVTIQLDFGIEQADYSIDSLVSKIGSYTNQPSSSLHYTSSKTLGRRYDANAYIHISTKGWHTLMFKSNAGSCSIQAIEFIGFDEYINSKQTGLYKILTHSTYADTTVVTETNIDINDLTTVLGISNVNEYWKGQLLKIQIYNYDNSINEYYMLFGSADAGNGFLLLSDNKVYNIVTTPNQSLVRTLTGVTYDKTTRYIKLMYGGATNRPTSIIISIA